MTLSLLSTKRMSLSQPFFISSALRLTSLCTLSTFSKVESVHREVNRRADEIKKGCERDIRLVDNRLRVIEKKMWTIAGALTVISFLVSVPGQKMMQGFLTPNSQQVIIERGK